MRVENLGKTFRSGSSRLTVFSAVNFELLAGGSVALIGESGAGKSTLLHLLGALDLPSEGEIYYQSRPLSAFSEPELADFRNRQTGYVWQSYHLLPEFTALENVMMPLLIARTERGEAISPAREWLARVGLADRASHRAGELSGGEQQRIAIARALVTRPRLVLADEPTGNLDERTATGVVDLLLRLCASEQATIVIATHNLAFARRCERVFRIEGGGVSPCSLGE